MHGWYGVAGQAHKVEQIIRISHRHTLLRIRAKTQDGRHADEMCVTSVPPDKVACDGGMVRGSYLTVVKNSYFGAIIKCLRNRPTICRFTILFIRSLLFAKQ